MRRSHHALKKTNLVACTNCAEPTLPHRICSNCGHYKGKLIMPIED
jgi:large subunit ribosomal protein L32